MPESKEIQIETKKIINRFAILLIGFFFVQCKDAHYHQSTKTISNSWGENSAEVFEFKIDDTTSKYDFRFLIRNNNDYPYANIYFLTKMIDPNENEYSDTVQYYMAHPDGSWVGSGMNLKEMILVYKENVSFKDTGSYTLSVRQGMREEELKGIEDITFIIDKKQNIDEQKIN